MSDRSERYSRRSKEKIIILSSGPEDSQIEHDVDDESRRKNEPDSMNLSKNIQMETIGDFQLDENENNDFGLSELSINRDDVRKSSYRLIGITLFNFKSYSGLEKIGPFTDFTVIIGPNGSGKSNIMDAVSFALLFPNLKLRSKKNSELICEKPSVLLSEFPDYSCYVTLHFDDKSSDNQDTNFTITRAIEKKRFENVYLLDDIRVAKIDYEKKLKSIGLQSREKPFMIFQNTITDFITAEPKFFTNVIEELSGSVEYKKDYGPAKVCLLLGILFFQFFSNIFVLFL